MSEVPAGNADNQHDEHLATLVSMGFNASKAEQALEASGGGVDSALGYLLSGGVRDTQMASTSAAVDKKKNKYGVSVRNNHENLKEYSYLRHASHARHVPWSNPNEEGNSNIYQSLSMPRRHEMEDSGGDDEISNVHGKTSKEKLIRANAAIPTATLDIPSGNDETSGPTSTEARGQREPGAEAVQGTCSFQPLFRPAAPNRGDEETYLASAQVVSDDDQQRPEPPGPLVLASPMPSGDADRRRDMKRIYAFGSAAVLLVLVAIGVAVALVFLLGDITSGSKAGSTAGSTADVESIGPPVTVTSLEPGRDPTATSSEPASPTLAPISMVSATPTEREELPGTKLPLTLAASE